MSTNFDPRAYFDSYRPAAILPKSQSNLKSSRTFISGPLPQSALLYTALHHLRHHSPTLENQSEIKSKPKVLILSVDRVSLATLLAEENDISIPALDPVLKELLDSIEIKYLPTSAHFNYYLNTLYTYTSPALHSAFAAFKSFNTGLIQDPSYLNFNPTLVILNKPSHYLSESIYESAGSEAYTGLLALLINRISSLCLPIPEILVLDRDASVLTLPIVPPSVQPISYRNSAQLADQESRKVELNQLAENMKVFDRVGFIERLPIAPASLNPAVSKKRYFNFLLRDSLRDGTTSNPEIEITFSLEESVTEEDSQSSTRIVIE